MFKKAISLLLSLMLIITSLSITAISVSAADIKYVVAGTANLCDSSWDFSEESGNIMTEKEDGTYELVFSPAEELGIVQIKVAKLTDGKVQADEDYYGDATGNNITFKVTDAGDVTVTFNPSTKEIKVKGDNVEMVSDLKIDAMRAVGNGDGNWLNGVGWDPADDSNKMTEVSDNVYEISYEGLEAYDNYQVKFAANGSWTDNWGGEFKASGVKTDADYNGGNITIDVPEDDSTVKLTLDLTGFDYASKTGAKFTVTINGEEQEETTVAPTTEAVTTKPEETTTAPAEEGLNVKATSNYFPEFTQHFDASTDTVTVTYFINSEKRMLNSQWKLTYDPSVLKFNADKNVDEDDNWTFMPQAGDAVCNPADAGIIKGNCTSLKLYRLQTKTGGKVPFVSVTFDVVGTGNTTVNLELEVMQIANLDPTTKQEDPDTEETVARGSEILEVSVPITRVAYVYEGTLDPSYEPATEAPTTEAPTTEAPTTEAPTTEAPTTEAPTTEAPTTEAPTTEAPTTAASALTVKATSNFFPEFTQSFDADTKSVTVTYFINSEKRMLNSQWTLKYDPTVLQFNAEKNSDADGNWTMMPQASDAMCNPYVDGQPGTIKANCTNLKLYKLQTADGNEVEFVTVTFDVIGSGETTVDLDLEVMQIANLDPTTKLEDESTEEDVVIGSTVLPFTTPIARRTLVTAGKTEPTTEAPTTEAPTTEAPTTEPSQLLNITAKSNVAADAKYSVNFADDSTKIVTVTYYYQDVKDLLSTQWNLSYDPEYLELKTTSGFMPFAGDDAIYNVTDGNVKGSVSNLSLYDFSTKKPYVQLTFEAKKPGNTDVLLIIDDLLISELDPSTGKSDESKEQLVIINGEIGDLTENAFEAEIIGGTPVQPTTAPVTTEPVTTEPVTTEPVTTEPVTTEPVTTEPVTTEPVTTEPVTTEPVTTEPVTTEPVTTEPVTTEPVTTEPVTTEPVTTEPATTAPATTAPATTVAPTTSTDATSASGATTPTSKGQSTSDQSTVKPSTSTGAVQTGNASMALIILSVLISATAAVYFARKKIK